LASVPAFLPFSAPPALISLISGLRQTFLDIPHSFDPVGWPLVA
jgi:hypothetical protein